MINLEKSKYILTIAELSSFSKAAEKLFVAQSSLSRYISELENKLGVKLFDRIKLPIELTYAGERYIEYMKNFLNLESKMNDEFNNLKNSSMDNLTVGSFVLMGTYILPNILPTFLKHYPNVNFNIRNEVPSKFEYSLINGAIDICLINLPPKNKNIPYQKIGDDKILLVAPTNNHISKKYDIAKNSIKNPVRINFKEIENEKFILLPNGHNMRFITESIFEDNKIAPKNILEVPNLNMAVDLVSANMGFTFVCKSTMSHKKLVNPLMYFSVGKLENMASIILAYYNKNNALINSFIEISKKVFGVNNI